MREIKIEDFTISENSKTFVIGEISANHNGSFENTVKLIKAAKNAGVDAIKLQTYTADTITLDCDNEYFQINQGTIWDGKTLYKLYKEAHMPWEWQGELKKIIQEEGMICFSSPFDKTAVDYLEKINVPAYKVASFEITDIPLIEYMASKGKPMIISTGIAELEDIKMAMDACKRMGNNEVILLKCTSAYPAPIEDVNLRALETLKEEFDVLVGISDHTLGIEVPIAAVALGAKVIEKHITLSREEDGVDSTFSLEPHELKSMISAIRDIEKAMGKREYYLTEKQKKSKEFSRSLFIVDDIKVGEKFTDKNIRSIRPGYGLHTKYYNAVIGQVANVDLIKGTPMELEYVK